MCPLSNEFNACETAAMSALPPCPGQGALASAEAGDPFASAVACPV